MGFMEAILRNLRDTSYDESAELAKEKGPFPLWEWEAYSKGKFIETLPQEIQDKILATGIRNSHPDIDRADRAQSTYHDAMSAPASSRRSCCSMTARSRALTVRRSSVSKTTPMRRIKAAQPKRDQC